jgi:Mrp family chromosome partitioning ATPase
MGDLAAIREHYLARLAELKRRKEAALAADIDRLRSQVDHAENQASQIEREIDRQNTDAEKQRTSLVEVKILKGDIGRTEEVLGRLTQKIKEVEVEQGSGCPISLIQGAETPRAPSNRSIMRAADAAIVALCFLLPAACIMWWDVTRRFISDPRDLSSNLGLRVLATLPAGVKRRFDWRHRLRGSRAARQRIFDAVESLQMAIFHDRQPRSRVLLVCGAESNEGTAAVVRELAMNLAAGGCRTVLVDASLRQPRLHERFEIPLECGVSEVLCECAEVWEALHQTEIENLWLAPAGRWSPKVHAAMLRGNTALLVDTLRATFQYVIIAGGPVLHGSETQFFGRCADAVLFTAQRDITRVGSAVEAVEKLQSLRVNLMGAAVVT